MGDGELPGAVSIVPPPEPAVSLAERAYRELERRLVTLEFRPGDWLQEQDLINALGIGRTPVREAAQRLAGHGVLRIRPRKGLWVMPIDANELGRVFEARRVIERLLVVKAAERADDETCQHLLALADELDAVATEAGELFRLDRRLDEVLAAACANPYLGQSLAPMHLHCRRLWYLNRQSLDVAEAARMHARLARCVAARDRAGAIGALNGIITTLESLQAGLGAIS